MITSDRVKLNIEYIDPCLCNAWVATAIIGSAVIGGAATAYSANKAANAQENAAAQAANTQLSMYDQTNANLAPYRNLGQQASDYTSQNLSSLIAPINMNEETLQNTPGYQFNLTQGLKAAQNSAAARGLGTSGAALKGATTFATGLADSTYQNQFNNAVTNQTNAYNRLAGLINTGENAAAGTGQAATATGQGVAASETAAGNAAAAGANATGTAATNIANSVPNAFLTAGLYNKIGSGVQPTTMQIGNYTMPVYG